MLVPIILYTYDRLDYAETTIRGLFAPSGGLRPPEGVDLWLHIADDGSSQEYRDRLWNLAGEYVGDRRSITNSERRGYGGSYNAASWFVHQLPDVAAILQLEDDWLLSRPLALGPLLDVLRTEARVGCIRLGYIGYIPGYTLRAEFVWTAEQHFLLLDPASPSQYVFSGGPRLETVQWARKVGPWPEMLPAGETELAVCGRLAAREGVAWPVDLVPPRGGLFEHIGARAIKDAPLGQRHAEKAVAV